MEKSLYDKLVERAIAQSPSQTYDTSGRVPPPSGYGGTNLLRTGERGGLSDKYIKDTNESLMAGNKLAEGVSNWIATQVLFGEVGKLSTGLLGKVVGKAASRPPVTVRRYGEIYRPIKANDFIRNAKHTDKILNSERFEEIRRLLDAIF